MSGLKNAVTLVTGGASVVGKCVARQFLNKGSRIVLCDLPDTGAEEVAKELGENCLFVPTDVKKEEDVQRAVEDTKQKFGKLNNVINCAEWILSSRPANWKMGTSMPKEAFDEAIMMNVSAIFNVIRHTVPLISQNEREGVEPRGVIINKSNIAPYEGYIGMTPMAACKGAVNAMTLPLAREFSEVGIRVVAIAHGFLADASMVSLPPQMLQVFEREVLSPPRLGDPEEYAQLCESIVNNPMLNGQVIRLDGGLRLKH